jgi:hypothetical protein
MDFLKAGLKRPLCITIRHMKAEIINPLRRESVDQEMQRNA